MEQAGVDLLEKNKAARRAKFYSEYADEELSRIITSFMKGDGDHSSVSNGHQTVGESRIETDPEAYKLRDEVEESDDVY